MLLRTKRHRAARAAIPALSLFAAASAAAAPAPPCFPATITPTLTGEVPATLPAFAYSAVQAKATDIHLFDVTGGAKNEVALTLGPVIGGLLKVAPASPLVPGESYQLQYAAFCDYGGFSTEPLSFTAGPAAPLPTHVGQIVGAPQIREYPKGNYSLQATYAIADEMKPWTNLVHFSLIWRDTNADMFIQSQPEQGTLHATADGPCSNLTQGTTHHSFVLRATRVFADPIESDPTDVELDCAAVVPATPATPSTPSTPSTPAQNDTTSSSSTHHGCAAGPGAASPGAALAAIGAIGAAFARRRRVKRITAPSDRDRAASAATRRR